MPWAQVYDPLGNWWLSTILAAIPIVVLLGSLALLHMRAHYSALLGLASALVIAVAVFGMPTKLAGLTAGMVRPSGCFRSAGSFST
jgi:lactate permease